ncbi:MAG: tetrahydrodipicolinate N-succinyltransferase N-terminal domain-containing protein [Pseudomonadales bacterium]|jgi:2,3,4,5-tetrahydropyridine-2-carboxylate N-succinyltransferase
MSEVFAFAIGPAHRNARGNPLDFFFPAPIKRPDAQLSAAIAAIFGAGATEVDPTLAVKLGASIDDQHQTELLQILAEADAPLTAILLDDDTAIQSTAEAYLKLHLLSHRLAVPNSLNLDGIFEHLPNVAWTDQGPLDPIELVRAQLNARIGGSHIEVFAIDKFPRMTNYVIPSGVRIADASRIRLGAYLGEGTTVMHEGQVNFNAGALGPNMVEGRISQGVVVGAHSDLGGSSSTMGTLSGGGQITISIGEHCLVGANAGTGIPLGDRCTIEAGLYITAGTPLGLLDESGELVKNVKARELAGGSDLLFIRNGLTGRIECRSNRKAIELNDQLHAHN